MAAFACAGPAPLLAQSGQAPALVKILDEELLRNFQVLKEKGEPPAYFLSYAINDQESWLITTTSGLLAKQDNVRSRVLDVSIRLGNPKLDNYRRTGRDWPSFTSGSQVSMDDSPAALKRRLWNDTDAAYRSASQRLLNLQTNTQVKVESQDKSDDFSAASPVVQYIPVAAVKMDLDQWAKRTKSWSARFQKYPQILNNNVTVLVQREVKTFVNSEGTKLQHGRTFARILITARTKASDGMDLFNSDTIEAELPDGLPKDEQVNAAVDKVARDLVGLLQAPEVEPFVGPAILSGKAAGVFFHEIFGHRIEGHRQKEEVEGQTFTKKVNQSVLPSFLSVTFDPTLHKLGKEDLYGWFHFDDEGVPAQKVTAVENGILKNFLMSRSPIAGFPKSNGHGRRQAGAEVVSRQSNLLVSSTRQVSDAQLRQQLLEELKKQNKPYGLYFESVTGGYTTTGRAGLQAFTVMPVIVYRIYADGRPDELVRGVDIVGTPLASFAKIIATGNTVGIFNGYCGAESGSVPVSASSPALLVAEIEVQKKNKGQDRPPLLDRPEESR